MNSMDWLDTFLEECDNGSDIFMYEGSDDGKTTSWVSVTKEKIKTIIDKVIQKIRDIITNCKIRYTSVKFKVATGKLTREMKKQLKAEDISGEVKKIVINSYKEYLNHCMRGRELFQRYLKGTITYTQFTTQYDATEEKWKIQCNTLNAKIDRIHETEGLATRRKLAPANDILVSYEGTIYQLSKLHDMADQVVEKHLNEVKSATITEDSPAEVAAATSLFSKILSSIFGGLTQIFNKIFSVISSAGNKIVNKISSMFKGKEKSSDNAIEESGDNEYLDEADMILEEALDELDSILFDIHYA